MPYDALLMFSQAQAITATAASTDVLDLGLPSVNPLSPTGARFPAVHATDNPPVVGKITTSFAGATAIVVALQGSDDNSTWGGLASTTLAAADLVAGKEFSVVGGRPHKYRYERLNYTVTGTVTAGAITAGYNDGIQTAGYI